MATLPGLFRCPSLSNSELIAAFEANPSRIRKGIEGLSDEEMRARVIAGKWSIKEIVVHVVDTEIMMAGRLRQALTGSERTFAFWDQEIWAEGLRYQEAGEAELKDVLLLYEYLRRTSGHLLRRITEGEWAKSGMHQRRGEMTIRLLLEHHTVHCERHLKQILQRREILGKPLVIPDLFPMEG